MLDPLHDPFEDQSNLAEQDEKQREREDDEFLKLMADPKFRRFMWRLWERTGVFRSSFQDGVGIYFLEGQRNIGLAYLEQVNRLCPEQYVKTLLEATEEATPRTDA